MEKSWKEFISEIIDNNQVEEIKKAIKEGKTLYFYGPGIGKTSLSNLFNNLGIAAIGHAINAAAHKVFIQDEKHFKAIKLYKNAPEERIPNLHELLLEQKDEIRLWIID